MIENENFRLVSIIKKNDKNYDVLNFLPDIQIVYIEKSTFKVVRDLDYIKIPYTNAVNDLTIIVGENGIGKTRLLNDIVNRHSDRILLFKRGDDYFIDNSNVGEFALRSSDSDIYINLNYLSLSKLPIIKLSNSIEIIVDSSEHDISTSRMLHEENLLAINKKDMNSQIKFILSSDNFDAVQDILSFSGKVISVNFNFNPYSNSHSSSSNQNIESYLDFIYTTIANSENYQDFIYDCYDDRLSYEEFLDSFDAYKFTEIDKHSYFEYLVEKFDNEEGIISDNYLKYLENRYNISSTDFSIDIEKKDKGRIDLFSFYSGIDLQSKFLSLLKGNLIHMYSYLEADRLAYNQGMVENFEVFHLFLHKVGSNYTKYLPEEFVFHVGDLINLMVDCLKEIQEELDIVGEEYFEENYEELEIVESSKGVIEYIKQGKLKESVLKNLIEKDNLNETMKSNFSVESFSILLCNLYKCLINDLLDSFSKIEQEKWILEFIETTKELPSILKRDLMVCFSNLIEYSDIEYLRVFYYCRERSKLRKRTIEEVIDNLSIYISRDEVSHLKTIVKFMKSNKSNFEIFSDKYQDLNDLITALSYNYKFHINNFDFSQIQEILNSIEFSWNALSSGEYALLNLFGRLYSKSQTLNETTDVIVLLDEVDLGLHPEWQRKWINSVLPIIGKIFKEKNIQIVMTTHSPVMLSDVFLDNVIMLRRDGDSQRKVIDVEKDGIKTFGQNIYDLYRSSFFLDSTRGNFSNDRINVTIHTIYELLGDNPNKEKIRENFLQSLLFDKNKTEEKFKKILKKIINSIGETMIRKKLMFMYEKAFPNTNKINERIQKLEKELEELKKKTNLG